MPVSAAAVYVSDSVLAGNQSCVMQILGPSIACISAGASTAQLRPAGAAVPGELPCTRPGAVPLFTCTA